MTTIYFGTNRNPDHEANPTDFGKNFSEAGLGSLRFGEADVTEDGFVLHPAEENMIKNKALKQKDGEGSKLGSLEIFSNVRTSMKTNDTDTILYIHGYNVSFEEALQAAKNLKQNFATMNNGKGVNVVLFSWPSDGSMMPYIAYANDRQDAVASGPAFARGIMKLADFLRGSTPEDACNQHVHLVAHSMGNYVLRNALQEIVKLSPGRPPRLFDQIFLMAADEDDDAFELDHKLKFLPRLAKRVNVYFNNGDKGMAVSDKTKGNPDRLGDDGPRLPRNIPGKVTLIDCTDCSDMATDGLAQHSYYVTNPTVIADMASVLDGRSPKDIRGDLYDTEMNRYRLPNSSN